MASWGGSCEKKTDNRKKTDKKKNKYLILFHSFYKNSYCTLRLYCKFLSILFCLIKSYKILLFCPVLEGIHQQNCSIKIFFWINRTAFFPNKNRPPNKKLTNRSKVSPLHLSSLQMNHVNVNVMLKCFIKKNPINEGQPGAKQQKSLN